MSWSYLLSTKSVLDYTTYSYIITKLSIGTPEIKTLFLQYDIYTTNYVHLVVAPMHHEITQNVYLNSNQDQPLLNETSSKHSEQISLSGRDIHFLSSTVIGSRPGPRVCEVRGSRSLA